MESGASAHMGITAPPRAKIGIRSMGVSTVRNRLPPTSSPLCQSYQSPAGRYTCREVHTRPRSTGATSRSGPKQILIIESRTVASYWWSKIIGRWTGSPVSDAGEKAGVQIGEQAIAQLDRGPEMIFDDVEPNAQAYWSTLPISEWLRQNGVSTPYCIQRRNKLRLGVALESADVGSDERLAGDVRSPAPIAMLSHRWSQRAMVVAHPVGGVALDPGETGSGQHEGPPVGHRLQQAGRSGHGHQQRVLVVEAGM